VLPRETSVCALSARFWGPSQAKLGGVTMLEVRVVVRSRMEEAGSDRFPILGTHFPLRDVMMSDEQGRERNRFKLQSLLEVLIGHSAKQLISWQTADGHS